MSNEDVSIGKYEIVSCTLKKWNGSNPVSIGNLVTEFGITESIVDQAVSGYMVVLDAIGLVEEYPIIGEEIVELKYKDSFENSISGRYHVYRVDNNEFDFQGQKQAYMLKFHSLDFVKTESVEIRRSYRGNLSDSAQDVFNEYFDRGQKKLDKEIGSNEATIVVPAMTPWQSINLFAKKAFSDENETSNFVFFESREKYHFKTYEKLFEDGRKNITDQKTFKYHDPRISEGDRVVANMQTIRDFLIKSRFDLVNEIRSGAMLNETIVLDLATKAFEEIVYKHDGEFSNYKHSDSSSKDYHSGEFVSDFFNEETNMRKSYVVFDDSTLEAQGEETMYGDILPKRAASSYYMNQLVMVGKIYGRNDLFVGDVIKLELPQFKYSVENDKTNINLSGHWLISRMQHIMTDNIWETNLTLVKDSYKGGT